MQQFLTPRTPFGFSGPLYSQVAAYVRDQITNGAWTTAAPLPNEAALAKDIGVSVGTVRKALEILEAERLIKRRQGRGTYVVDADDQSEAQRFSSVWRNGRRLIPDVVSYRAEIGPASQPAAETLGLGAGENAIVIHMEWTAGRDVDCRERIVVSARRFPGLETAPRPSAPTLHPVYRRRYQTVVNSVDEFVGMPSPDMAPEAAPDISKVCITRVARTRGGEAIEWSERVMALGAARYRYSLT